PPGKVLEMATIDAAKALDKAEEIGSIEVGKSADVILLDMRKPHLWPPSMPVDRAIYFANGADVDTTIVAGQILMRGRQVKSLDEAEVLDRAAAAETQMLERTGLSDRMVSRPGFWGQSRFD
ncbi:MAG: amidohydrolase family protein, partial [Rhodospirillaceae bacterium]|nr:amidohydrolase family protein [Rhodospirillaceae bacterium]